MSAGSRTSLGLEQIRAEARDSSVGLHAGAEQDTIGESIQRPDGEIGRHSGLKIRRPETVVGVQVPLRAP
jgi:hypothetical protein